MPCGGVPGAALQPDYKPVIVCADAYPDGDEALSLDPTIGSETPYLLHQPLDLGQSCIRIHEDQA